jgi:hypothetical protein
MLCWSIEIVEDREECVIHGNRNINEILSNETKFSNMYSAFIGK